jgi:tRNA G37 N-methylase Trm5
MKYIQRMAHRIPTPIRTLRQHSLLHCHMNTSITKLRSLKIMNHIKKDTRQRKRLPKCTAHMTQTVHLPQISLDLK